MLARVPIISAYDPSTESMLAHAYPSYKIAIMVTGLVIDSLGTNPSSNKAKSVREFSVGESII